MNSLPWLLSVNRGVVVCASRCVFLYGSEERGPVQCARLTWWGGLASPLPFAVASVSMWQCDVRGQGEPEGCLRRLWSLLAVPDFSFALGPAFTVTFHLTGLVILISVRMKGCRFAFRSKMWCAVVERMLACWDPHCRDVGVGCRRASRYRFPHVLQVPSAEALKGKGRLLLPVSLVLKQ